jgi:hypothetical protein
MERLRLNSLNWSRGLTELTLTLDDGCQELDPINNKARGLRGLHSDFILLRDKFNLIIFPLDSWQLLLFHELYHMDAQAAHK